MAPNGGIAVESQLPTTLLQSYVPVRKTPAEYSIPFQNTVSPQLRFASHNDAIRITRGVSSTGKGILIGMLSAFGSALFVALVLSIIYFFRYTSRGRILLDRLGRPGEFDDEQAFAREEAEALEQMDELQRTEYMRAKGRQSDGRWK